MPSATMPSMKRAHRWRSAIAPVVDAVGREPEIHAPLRDDDAPKILVWVDRHLAAAEDALVAHRGKYARIAEIAERLEDADLLDEVLRQLDYVKDVEAGGDQWSIASHEEDLEDQLVGRENG